MISSLVNKHLNSLTLSIKIHKYGYSTQIMYFGHRNMMNLHRVYQAKFLEKY